MWVAPEVIPQDLLSPSTLFNAGGWMAMGVGILVALQRGWIITKSSHERELSLMEKAIEEKDENYSNMVALKDKAYNDMLAVKDDQIKDQRNRADEWKAAAGAADVRSDVLAGNQQELMAGIQMSTQFIEGIYYRSGGGAG